MIWAIVNENLIIELIDSEEYPERQCQMIVNISQESPQPQVGWSLIGNKFQPPNQKEKDYNKYIKRAEAKNKILAEMASENMERVRNGVWSVPQLVGLTQDVELKLVLDDVNTLSFELAQSKLLSCTNPLLTTEIKMGWIAKLQANLYN